jgi:hypothetical protein
MFAADDSGFGERQDLRPSHHWEEWHQGMCDDFNILLVFFYPGSRIKKIPDPHKIVKYFLPKKLFLSSRKYDPGCSTQIPDPEVKKAPDPVSGSATLHSVGFSSTSGEKGCFFCS